MPKSIPDTLKVVRLAFYGAAIAAMTYSGTLAQEYPTRAIRVLSTTPTGGAGDVAVRLIADHASRVFKEGVVVEVQSAATGQIATQTIARAQPDGYSLLWGNSNIVNTQAVKKDLPFDVLRDLAPISLTITSPLLLVVNASLPVKSLDDFVAYARARPGELAFGSVGVGSGIYLAGESLGQALGARLRHVPYATSGMATQLTDLAENRIQVLLLSWSTIQPILTSGKIRVLAVLSKDRYPPLPDIPPITAALPNFNEVPVWFGMLAPAATPKPVISQWSSEIRNAVRDPKIKGQLDRLGLQVSAGEPDQMKAAMQTGIKNISALVKDLNLEVQ